MEPVSAETASAIIPEKKGSIKRAVRSEIEAGTCPEAIPHTLAGETSAKPADVSASREAAGVTTTESTGAKTAPAVKACAEATYMTAATLCPERQGEEKRERRNGCQTPHMAPL